ncbi:primary-amine oxidase [Oculatella sp. LEGE 06141]|uniref:primary-amine oxidase n=1 Tax=Oculatella sp. LEGE 06141 TaxID=1828648 RepID=UPI001881E5D0|nr:primary-amine oxidase [Oculatella sp. LEGE 06141]MBE9180008.1 primary-amine oxidase [Oculatella sp. LEGE 06141]
MTTTPLPKAPHPSTLVQHPLDPLTAAEITSAVAIVSDDAQWGTLHDRHITNRYRFATIVLHEPAKSVVQHFKPGDAMQRQAFIVVLDNTTGHTYEAIVSLTDAAIVSWKHVPGVQPNIMLDEFLECEATVKAHPDFQAALQKRGITNFDGVMVDPWSAGNFGIEAEAGLRLTRTFAWVRSEPNDNGYARPIEGVTAVVDLNKMEVIQVEDKGVVPLPPRPGNYASDYIPQFRTDLKPLEIVQPEGTSFEVDGYKVYWQKWHFRVGFTPREGLVLYEIGYEDDGQIRPILYRAALAEMVVPYNDPSLDGSNHYRKNAFDVGEYGVGMLANSLTLGCDCLGEIYYFDAILNDSRGGIMKIDHAVCMHEEDYGILWKHMDWRTNHTEVRRSRRLVVSFIATVGNYEYGFFWYFYQDGSIQYEVKLTGIVNTSAVAPGVTPQYGTLIAPQLNAHLHQHFFNVRLDFDIDGNHNSVYEVNTEPVPLGPENPHGNACYTRSTLLATEQEAQRPIDPFKGRYWKIVNPSKLNSLGQAVGYKLAPGENILPFAHPDSSLIKRAGFTTKHLWVTPYEPSEKYPAGDYPNQHPGGEGLPQWTQANRPVENTDVVVWYTFGHHHVPRPEDWPVMPTAYIGFMLKPVSFFEQNPAMDVPPSAPKLGDCCHS